MAKVDIPAVPSGYGMRNTLNTILQEVETILNDKVLWRDNPAGEPNSMKQDLDMDGNDVLNVGHLDVDTLLVAGQNYEDTLSALVDLAKDEADRSRDEADRSLSYAQASQASAVAAAGSAQSARDSSVFLQEFIDDYAQEILHFPLDLGFLTDVPVTSSYDLGSLL